jgi:hypothetical protein
VDVARHRHRTFDLSVKNPNGAKEVALRSPQDILDEIAALDAERQRRIVAILDEAFEGIATAKANAEKNLRNAREVFESHLQVLFSPGQDGWGEQTLGETYDVRDGTHDSPKYHNSGFPLITSKNLKRDGLSFDDVKLISETDYRKINERSAVHKGDVLLAMIGTIGNPNVVEVEPDFAIKNVALLKVPKGQNGYFLRHYLSSQAVVEKMHMNEAETRAEHIDPALKAAGWGVVEGSRILREHGITQGRLQGGGGKRAKAEIADYVLVYRNTKLAVVEAKAWDKPYTEGVGRPRATPTKLAVRFAYATNGQAIYGIDMKTGAEGDLAQYPSPDELWNLTFAEANAWRDRFAAMPFEDKGGAWQGRYYQDIAITRVLDAIADGRDRILLTLATGTGKTFIAFQLAWKLFQSRWNLKDWKQLSAEPTRRPRILFLADRNILADQAYNAFSTFPGRCSLVRIAPDEIRKKGRVPKNGSIFFTIFQTFMSGPGDTPYFGEYPPDFFDFIVIDECHRGGANDESNWRAILDYFAPAVQLGLTATPKRTINADTYAYFGEPVYVYSLKEGINDGFPDAVQGQADRHHAGRVHLHAGRHRGEGEVVAGKRYEERTSTRSSRSRSARPTGSSC